ncbi:DUF2510 domain-containing protein [Aestuariimicrobium soli]|uniref:DUF2510 domain-containing protein n=1 Tax=Aestuariimicrobium soli TaxID=2035834 RepID=UPI003EB93492
MSAPGWYPDPAGSGGVRHWDGDRWGTEVRPAPDPSRTTAGLGGGGGGKPGGKGWVAVVVVALVVVAVVVIALQQRRGTTLTEDTNSSTPTVSQWDESSSPTSGPTKPPPTLNPTGARERSCENLTGSSPQQTGDRVSSGGLSFPAAPGWRRYSDRRLPFAKNAAGLYVSHPEEKLGWASSMAVAQVNMPEGYPGSSTAATRIAQCLVTSSFYTSVDVTLTDVTTEPIDLAGTPARGFGPPSASTTIA